MAKSGQHPELRDFLLGTGSWVLVEASSRERVWGTGLAAADDRGTSTAYWQGLNPPGFALMEVRHRLRARAPPECLPGHLTFGDNARLGHPGNKDATAQYRTAGSAFLDSDATTHLSPRRTAAVCARCLWRGIVQAACRLCRAVLSQAQKPSRSPGRKGASTGSVSGCHRTTMSSPVGNTGLSGPSHDPHTTAMLFPPANRRVTAAGLAASRSPEVTSSQQTRTAVMRWPRTASQGGSRATEQNSARASPSSSGPRQSRRPYPDAPYWSR